MALADRIRFRIEDMGVDIDNLQDFQKELILRAGGLADAYIVLTGAAAIPDETVRFFKDKLGFHIDQGYGVTETSPGISANCKENWKLGTCGKPLFGMKVKILDDDMNELPAGEEGEIVVSGPNVFNGYHKDEEKTRQVLKEIDGEKWYFTRDIGIIDEDGFIRITDRKDDMLVPISGENVSSASVENKIILHSRYVGYAVPYGTGRDCITAVVWSDETKHGYILEDAKKAGIDSTDIPTILTHEKFKELLEKDLKHVIENGEFNNHERPRAFVFLVNPTGEEVTGTLKARKKGVRKKFEKQLDELYETGSFLNIVQQ